MCLGRNLRLQFSSKHIFRVTTIVLPEFCIQFRECRKFTGTCTGQSRGGGKDFFWHWCLEKGGEGHFYTGELRGQRIFSRYKLGEGGAENFFSKEIWGTVLKIITGYVKKLPGNGSPETFWSRAILENIGKRGDGRRQILYISNSFFDFLGVKKYFFREKCMFLRGKEFRIVICDKFCTRKYLF